MRLLKIHLRNVKSYGDAVPEIEFAPGVNFLAGLNGAGKTTIIEAIGYALFGVLIAEKKDFLRRGTKGGAITVWFEHEGETYRIVRKFGSTEAWVVYCKDDVTIEKRDDVQKFLRDIFKARDAKALENAFTYMIGVAQGTFTSAFKMLPSERKKIFDGIIDVDAYSRAAGERGAVKNQLLPNEIAALREKAAGAQGYIDGHKDDPRRLAELERRLLEIEAQVAELSRRRAELDEHKNALEAAKGHLDALDGEIQKTELEIRASEDARAQALVEVERSRRAAEVCKGTEEGHQAFLKAEREMGALEKKREKRDELTKRQQELEKKIAADGEAIRGMEKAIHERRAAEKEEAAEVGTAESDWKAQSERARLAETEAKKAAKVHEAASETLEAARKLEKDYLEQLGKARKAVEAILEQTAEARELEKALAVFEEVERVAKGADAARAKARKLDAQLSELNADIKAHQGNKKTLADLSCPFIKESCDRVRPDVFDGMIADLRVKTKALEKEIAVADKAVETAARAEKLLETLKAKKEERKRLLDAARREREKARAALAEWKPSWGKYPEFPAEGVAIEAFERYAKEWAAALDKQGVEAKGLATQEKQLEKAAGKERASADALLKAVDAFRKRLETTRRDLKKRDEELAVRKKGMAEATTRRTTLAKELAAYATLDVELARVRAELDERRSEHDAFAASEPVARELGKWEDQAAGWAARLEELRMKLEAARTARAAAASAYDPAEAARTVESLNDVIRQLGGLETEQRTSSATRTELEASVTRLRKEEAALAAAERDRKKLERFQRVLNDVWGMLRELGPRVSRRLLEGISSRANRIFGVLHDAPGRLQWGRDYEVRFKQGESDLPFSSLSGGEQMSAALSIQMAMARDFAGSSFCVFDEPTVHLDTARKGRLPAALRDAGTDAGFTQVFVVSHDDAFGPHVDHEIRLEKSALGTEVVG